MNKIITANGDEEAKELLESHQSFIQRMKSNDKSGGNAPLPKKNILKIRDR